MIVKMLGRRHNFIRRNILLLRGNTMPELLSRMLLQADCLYFVFLTL